MSDSMESMRHKLNSATDLQGVVRTMKAVAAGNIGQYEQATLALDDYAKTVDLGLLACFGSHTARRKLRSAGQRAKQALLIVVFGSDQGLVGQFNDDLANYLLQQLPDICKNDLSEPHIWAVGERVHARLQELGLAVRGVLPVPLGVQGITKLINALIAQFESVGSNSDADHQLYLFHQRPISAAQYQTTHQRLLPFDAQWLASLRAGSWPSNQIPECVGQQGVKALLDEYLFISMYRAAAQSLASENASRLAAMERAEKNIDELLADLHGRFHQLRQSAIDEELFDVIAGFEAMSK